MRTGRQSPEKRQSIDRALRLIEILVESPDDMGLTELTLKAKLPQGTTVPGAALLNNAALVAGCGLQSSRLCSAFSNSRTPRPRDRGSFFDAAVKQRTLVLADERGWRYFPHWPEPSCRWLAVRTYKPKALRHTGDQEVTLRISLERFGETECGSPFVSTLAAVIRF